MSEFENQLKNVFPSKNNITAKIRQQLQYIIFILGQNIPPPVKPFTI